MHGREVTMHQCSHHDEVYTQGERCWILGNSLKISVLSFLVVKT